MTFPWWAVWLACNGPAVPHAPGGAWPLVGAHNSVPCEGCHGSGTPEALPTDCLSCHDADRPDPRHNPGQDCGACHTPEGWCVGVTCPTDTDTDTDTDSDTDSDTDTDSGHIPTAPDQLCWECHEFGATGAPARPSADHHADPTEQARSWDCGPCHNQTSFTDGASLHPVRTPHGTYVSGVALQPEANWIVACADCHPSGPPAFECSSACHSSIFPNHHGLAAPGAAADAQCLSCHQNGDY